MRRRIQDVGGTIYLSPANHSQKLRNQATTLDVQKISHAYFPDSARVLQLFEESWVLELRTGLSDRPCQTHYLWRQRACSEAVCFPWLHQLNHQP